MSRRIRIVSSAAALVAGVVFGVHSSPADDTPAAGEPQVAAAAPNLAGRWKLDPERSEDARKKMREAAGDRRGGPGGRGPMGGPGGGMGGRAGGGMGGRGRGPGGPAPAGGDDPREAMRAVFEPASELLITPTEHEIVILEKDGRLRTLHPDGKKYKAEGGKAEVKARWEGAQLVVETRTETGAKTTETFVLSGESKAADPTAGDAATRSSVEARTLTITLRMEGTPMPALTVKRVYQLTESSAE